ncbi:MAG: hypothetical protein IIB69_12510 [Proteobacteria bacterium]|nr:hypothetical protein [Pseudomonadota bacterium]
MVDETSIVRGGNDLVTVARTLAAFTGGSYVTPQHVDAVAHGALSHRISYISGREPNSEGIKKLMHDAVSSARATYTGGV